MPTKDDLLRSSLANVPPKFGYMAAVGMILMTLGGVHIVWTHVWAGLTLFAIVSRDELLIGAMTVLGE